MKKEKKYAYSIHDFETKKTIVIRDNKIIYNGDITMMENPWKKKDEKGISFVCEKNLINPTP